MLYNVLKRMIERGQIEGMEEKLDIFYATDKITEEQYKELMAMLHPEAKTKLSTKSKKG